MKSKLTICALLYGDHVDMAARCLNSICRGAHRALPEGLRIGMNSVSQATERFVSTLLKHGWVLPENIYRSEENLHKYPMMRWMLYDTHRFVTTPYVMWFDDDSFITDKMIGATPDFLETVMQVMETPTGTDGVLPAMCGGVYTIKLVQSQQQWIEDQPWYTGKKVSSTMRFVTGGWWTARMRVLQDYAYPFEALDHRGGDVMLGALCEQQGLLIKNFRTGVAINADDQGRESKAPRRGFDQRPCGYDYRRDLRDVAKAQIETPDTIGPINTAASRAKQQKSEPPPSAPKEPEDAAKSRPPASASPRRHVFLDL